MLIKGTEARWVQDFLVWSQAWIVSLDLLWGVENRECALKVQCGGVWNSLSQASQRWKFYDFIIWSWSQQWEILLLMISKLCVWRFWGNYLGNYWQLGPCFSWTYFGGWREGGGCWNCMCFLWGIFVGRFKCGKMGWPWKKKLFLNKFVKALIPLKRDIRVYWNCMYLWGCSCEKREYCLKQKNNDGGGLSGPIEILYILWRHFGGLQWKKWESNRKGSIVKRGEMLWKACENLVECSSMCDSPIETVEYIWWIFGGWLTEFGHKTVEIHCFTYSWSTNE